MGAFPWIPLFVFFVFTIFLIAVLVVSVISIQYCDFVEYDPDLPLCFVKHFLPNRNFRYKFPAFLSYREQVHLSTGGRFLHSELYAVYDVASKEKYSLKKPDKMPVDARVFQMFGEPWLLFVDNDTQMSIIKIDDLQHSPNNSVQLYIEGVPSKYNKNWTPYQYAGDMYFITRLHPLQVVRCTNTSTGACIIVKDDQPGFEWDDHTTLVRGGSPLVPVGTPNVMIGVAHTACRPNHDWKKLCNYRVLLYMYDAHNLEIKKISKALDVFGAIQKQFHLRSNLFTRVHFGTAVEVEPVSGHVYLGVDVMDAYPFVVRLEQQYLKKFLESDDGWTMQQTLAYVRSFVNTSDFGFNFLASWFTWQTMKRGGCLDLATDPNEDH